MEHQNRETSLYYNTPEKRKIAAIAIVCHEANRAYCTTQGDESQKPWNEAEEWQKQSAIKGVEYALSNPLASPKMQHQKWCQDKIADGWVYGPYKDAEKKQHPCLIPYEDLPIEQRKKDLLFQAIVLALR